MNSQPENATVQINKRSKVTHGDNLPPGDRRTEKVNWSEAQAMPGSSQAPSNLCPETQVPDIGALVINWHITEVCNYNCLYCYAKWDKQQQARELLHDEAATTQMLGDLYRFFSPDNLTNPLRHSLRWSRVRLNIAGGEPLLYSTHVLAIARAAKTLGFEVSVITNGSRLTPELAAELAPMLTILGVSIDALETDDNWNIGRIDQRGRRLQLDVLEKAIAAAKALNPGLSLKVNTVVNSANHKRDLSAVVERLQPGKWKVLRVLPVLTDDLTITTTQFEDFVQRHQHFAGLMHPEDNSDMMESYIMVDPLGRFYQNALDSGMQGHLFSQPILEVGCQAAFGSLPFKPGRYQSRYVSLASKEAA